MRDNVGWITGLAGALVEGACLWAFDSLPAWAKWATLGGALLGLVFAVVLMRRERHRR